MTIIELIDKKQQDNKYTATSLFCGAGGLDMGFEQAGITSEDFDTDKLVARLPVILMISQFIWFNILGLIWSSLLANGAKHKDPANPFTA